MTTFQELPDVGNGYRLMGSTVIDEEQFRVEGWHLVAGQWTARLEGLHRYAQLRRQRKAERKAAWQTRQESDEEWSSHVSSLIERERETD